MTTLARCCVCSFIIIIHWCSTVSAQLVDIPDPNLRKAVRETLALADDAPITQANMTSLTKLTPIRSGITNLEGLEDATNTISDRRLRIKRI